MIVWMIPPWVPPGGWARTVREARAALGRTVRGARRVSGDAAGSLRRRWPSVRDRIAWWLIGVGQWLEVAARALAGRALRVQDRAARLVAGRAVPGSLRGAMDRARPLLARAGARFRSALRATGSGLAGGFGWARRHAPGPRAMAVAGVVLFVAGFVLWERCGTGGCPDVERLTSYQPHGATTLLDRDGEPFADLAPVDHRMVPLDSLPPFVPAAFVAVEDRRFYEHRGVDWRRVAGALWADIRARGLVQGSSTIPMQLSRNLFPERIRARDKTFRRKLLEMRIAGEIEDRFSKREILELYLNHIYFGAGAWGIEAASRYYFGRSATELELHQAALLAALPKAPNDYDPRDAPEAARTRRDLVLALMERQDYLSEREAAAARDHELDVVDEPHRDPDGEVFAPYFVQQVRRLLEERLGETLYDRPLRVTTSLDRRAQEAAGEELERQLERVEQGWYGRFRGTRYARGETPGPEGTQYVQGAVVVMEARTGEVLAWVGGRDYDHSRYDRALLARRQAGSAFKPFVYAAALESGLPASQPILDAPYRRDTGGARVWEPENYSGRFEGRMSMREALVRSQNIPAVRLAAATGDTAVASLARRVGIRGEVPASPVAALGVTVVSPLEMTAAYSAFAGLGVRTEPRFILRIEDELGNPLWESAAVRRPVLDPDVAWLLGDMLRDVVDYGTGGSVRTVGYWHSAAGKTGTTSDATDVWFVGYDPELVATVWVGYDEVKPLPAGATGGAIAAPVWGRMMARIRDEWPAPRWWDRPEGVITRRVDPASGRVLRNGCYPSNYDAPVSELFLREAEPARTCPRRYYGFRDRVARWFDDAFGYRDEEPVAGADPELGYPRVPSRDEVEEDEEEEEEYASEPYRWR